MAEHRNSDLDAVAAAHALPQPKAKLLDNSSDPGVGCIEGYR